jgi:hypothetical protein
VVQRWATGWMIGGVRVPVGAGNCCPHHRVQTCSGAHPASCLMGNWGNSPGVNRLGRETDDSPPSSAEVKNAWNYNSTPEYALIAWCSVTKCDYGQTCSSQTFNHSHEIYYSCVFDTCCRHLHAHRISKHF